MLKQWLHKIFSLAIALLVLVSTFSFSVEKRYCSDHLIDVAVFTELEDCSSTKSLNNTVEESKTKCCHDEIDILQGQDVLKDTSLEDIEFEQQLFLAIFIHSFVNLFEDSYAHLIPHIKYSHPNLVVNRQITYQVFLI